MSPAASARSRTPACETAAAIRTRGRLPARRAAASGGGSPERELSPRRVADGDDALEIERRVQLREQVDAGCDVEEGLGPTASAADAPVLEVPGGEPVGREIDAEIGHQRPVVLAFQYPPWTTTATPGGPGPPGRKSSPSWLGSAAVGVRRAGHAPDDAPKQRKIDPIVS